PDDEIEEYLGTASGALSPEALATHRDTLRATRARGYSVHASHGARATVGETAQRLVEEGVDDVDGELTRLVHQLGAREYLLADPSAAVAADGIQLSAPVFGDDGRVVLSVGVAFGGPDTDLAAVSRAPEELLATAAAITAFLGGEAPADHG
ncbi:MAG: hypothetical protein ABW219_12420, partial [Ilumatobacteraceae bacterium]